jgi:hypothetical protein
LQSPEAGDFRPASGSPALGYGCQTFAPERRTQPIRVRQPGGTFGVRRGVLDVTGHIATDTLWDAATVRVVGDVTIDDGVILTIAPGVRVEFQDYYRLDVAGTLWAVGTPQARIVFTTDEPEAFVVDQSHTGCWNGIRFENTRATNEPSRLQHCTIEYSKATGAGGGLFPYGGGALSVVDFSKLVIENCILCSNVADYGGAIFCYRNANPYIVGNLIVNCHALQNASAIYFAYSCPQVANNTIVQNPVHNEDNPYIESCAVLSFVSRPVFTNNIVRDNDPSVVYMHTQLWSSKPYYTHNNNIADYPIAGGNIDSDPRFADPGRGDYRLSPRSRCVDVGDMQVLVSGAVDLDGRPRVLRHTVDLGAYEVPFGDLDCDGSVDFRDINPFVLYLFDQAAWQTEYWGCDTAIGDINGDGVYPSAADINPFVALLSGG